MSSRNEQQVNGGRPRYDPLPFTCGVEIEHVFARGYPEIYYDKMMERLCLEGADISGLTEWKADDDSADWPASAHLISLLECNELQCKYGYDVGEDEQNNDTEAEYQTWTVVGDVSILSTRNVTPLGLSDQFKEAIPTCDREKGWEANSSYQLHGMELVSPPLAVPAAAGTHDGDMDEVKRYLDVLLKADFARGQPEYSPPFEAFASSTCGGHIHIGLPGNEALPTALLQHLAYLLLRYEPLISSLHHHRRTPYPRTSGARYCDSNRITFQEDMHSGCSRAVLKWNNVRRMVFEKDMEIGKLAWLMGGEVFISADDLQAWHEAWLKQGKAAPDSHWGQTVCRKDDCRSVTSDIKKPNNFPKGDKYKISRLNNLPRCDCEGPRTIEFRQPAGSLDF
jgi:hypothetical protein